MYNLIFLIIVWLPLLAMDTGEKDVRNRYYQEPVQEKLPQQDKTFCHKVTYKNLCVGFIKIKLLTYDGEYIEEGLIEYLMTYNHKIMKSLLEKAQIFAQNHMCKVLGIYLPLSNINIEKEKSLLEVGFKKQALWVHSNFGEPHYFYEKKLLEPNNML